MCIIDRFRSYLVHEQNRSPHTVREYLHDVNEFASFITGDKPETFDARSVTTTDIRAWLAEQGQRIGARSMRRKLQSLRALFRYMMKREDLPANPAAQIQPAKLPKTLPKFVRADEVEAVLEQPRPDMKPWLEERNRLIVKILYSCGLRRAEIVALNDSDIRFSSAEMRVTGKGNKTRIIPLPDELITDIRHWQTTRDEQLGVFGEGEQPLFRTKNGRMSPATIELVTKKMLATTRSNARNPHALRHSFATAMLDGGADLNSVKEFLGHASIATTQIYTHVSFEQMRKDYNAAHPRARTKSKKE